MALVCVHPGASSATSGDPPSGARAHAMGHLGGRAVRAAGYCGPMPQGDASTSGAREDDPASAGAAATLLQRIAAGDAMAVKEVLDQYGGLVWSLARRFTPTHAEAEDAVQEIFVEIWRSAGRFNPQIAGESTFISTIARRRLIDRNRRRERDTLRGAAVVEDMPVGRADADRAALGEEAARAMAVMEELSVDQRRVLRMSIFQGMSHERIAVATGLPLGTVKTHARRGLIRVRQAMGIAPPVPRAGGGPEAIGSAGGSASASGGAA